LKIATQFSMKTLVCFNTMMNSLRRSICPALVVLAAAAGAAERPQTYCNPIDLPYRFQLDAPSRREAADPNMVTFQGEYWLFASKSGGYWHSSNMMDWQFVAATGLPIEDYAPAVAVLNGNMIYTAFNTRALYSTDDPRAGAWHKIADLRGYPDPDLFVDDDGRLYVYYGCANNGNIEVVELDPQQQFKVIKGPITCFKSDYAHHGLEVFGEENRGAMADGRMQMSPWLEGAWMNKRSGVYYLQYSAPGTQFKTYADGYYTATNPLGPFVFAPSSPFSHKPTGFIGGAGHSSTFEDHDKNFWHITTMSISVRHMFERRLGLLPVGFTADGQMYCDTYLGDYPRFVPGAKKNPVADNSPGWMLLSYKKSATASSALEQFPIQNAFDENIRTWWSAASGKEGEWLQVDLGNACRVDALQINFADQGVTNFGRMTDDFYRYTVQASDDAKNWSTVVDRSESHQDSPHAYVQLEQPLRSRYLRLTNRRMPGEGMFSISDFRIFGNALGKAPGAVGGLKSVRDASDSRVVHTSWKPVAQADFYIIRYGTARDRLFNNYQVYDATHFDINSLNTGVSYYFTIDAVNGSGIARGQDTVFVK
jgi:hypothetical protein